MGNGELRGHLNRRTLLGLAAMPWLGSRRPALAQTGAIPDDLRFVAKHRGTPAGEHRVSFRRDRDRLLVTTHISITVKVLIFTAFRFEHDAEEVWHDGRLVSVRSTTDDDGTRLMVSGDAVADGFRIIGEDGPYLAPAKLLTSNTLWDSRLIRETRLIDVQHGGEVGLVVKPLGLGMVDTPHGQVPASRYQIITPNYAGSVYFDGDGRWVKGLIERQGETLEFVLAA